jgi:kinetochore protein NNF1
MAEPASSQPTSPAPNASSVRGMRAEAFEKLLNGALEHTLSKVSYENFAACFPTWAQYKPRSLKEFHGQFVERLRATCQVRRPLGVRNAIIG